jgi:hypothetical protein
MSNWLLREPACKNTSNTSNRLQTPCFKEEVQAKVSLLISFYLQEQPKNNQHNRKLKVAYRIVNKIKVKI